MNRLVRPVSFAFEPDMVSVFSMILFGASGAPSLYTTANGRITSKGVCNIASSTPTFTATTDGSTAVITAVSSFLGLYVGMTVTGAGIPAATTISSMNAGAGTITLSANTTGAHSAESMVASGGQYTLTFGSNFSLGRLDTYNHLMQMTATWDETKLPGTASVAAAAPAAPFVFLINNQVGVAGQASVTIQMGKLISGIFTAEVPAQNELLRLSFALSRSSAI